MSELTKSENHSHFAVDQNLVYEMYRTIRGLRYRQIAAVSFPDKEFLNAEDITQINNQLKKFHFLNHLQQF